MFVNTTDKKLEKGFVQDITFFSLFYEIGGPLRVKTMGTLMSYSTVGTGLMTHFSFLIRRNGLKVSSSGPSDTLKV